MTAREELDQRYRAALERFLDARDEPALSAAYELGRRAVVDGLGVLDVATTHGEALRNLVWGAPAHDRARRAVDAAAFFQELLSPFEMTFRGYRQANDELRRQQVALEDVNRELEAFSYSVSHDLRAPLRSIDAFTRILARDHAAALDDAGRGHLGRVRAAAEWMARLIDDLLGLARVSRADLARGDVDLSALATSILDRLRGEAPGRDVQTRVEGGVRGRGDARLLAVVLENLLRNAWKFTAKRSAAEIAFGRELRDGEVVYFVRDNGAGFDMAYAHKLFGAFQRLHTRDEFDGTGIGLATVARVVRRHDGRVWAEAAVGRGATFYFTLDRAGRS
ncbi:MAG TPA: ATP-binding protein [Polyangia bacterium]|nr:ATP-binding protein [Polyangia bacterium]